MKNDFKKLHGLFVLLYLSTFMIGLLRSYHSIFYTIHPYMGGLTVLGPTVFFVQSKEKSLIVKIIMSNFRLKGSLTLKLAKVSTVFILFSFVLSLLSGILLNFSLYPNGEVYSFLHFIHSNLKFIIPFLVLTHVICRLKLKRHRKK